MWTAEFPFSDVRVGPRIPSLLLATRAVVHARLTGPPVPTAYIPPRRSITGPFGIGTTPQASGPEKLEFSWAGRGACDGAVDLEVHHSVPGALTVLAVGDSSRGQVTYARVARHLPGSGVSRLRLVPTSRANTVIRRARRRGQGFDVGLRVTFSPDAGRLVKQEGTITMPTPAKASQ